VVGVHVAAAVAVEPSEQPAQGLGEAELACAAPRWGVCDQLLDQGLVFQWVAEVRHDHGEVLVACVLEAWHRLVGLEEGTPVEGRGVVVEDRDRDAVEEEGADRRLRKVAVVVYPAVSRQYAPGRMPAIVPRQG
jgi:hypothetical protein